MRFIPMKGMFEMVTLMTLICLEELRPYAKIWLEFMLNKKKKSNWNSVIDNEQIHKPTHCFNFSTICFNLFF